MGLCGLSQAGILVAQTTPDDLSVLVKWTSTPVLIDGDLNDPIWQQTSGAVNFWQTFPSDTILAKDQTRILMAYDDDHLYVAAQCFSLSDNYVVPTLKRDYDAGGSDNITLLFDTYNEEIINKIWENRWDSKV